jgi:hypothetical protein
MESIPLDVRLIVGVIVSVTVFLLVSYFRKQDKKVLAKQLETDNVVIISDYQFVMNYIGSVIKDAIVFGYFMATVIVVFALWASIVISYLAGIEVTTTILETLFGLGYMFGLVFVIVTPTFLFSKVVNDQKQKRLGRFQPIPGFLVSKQYSLVSHLYVGNTGIEGRICLPWFKVRSLVQLDSNTIKITYRRSPEFLTRLIKADALVIRATQAIDIDAIVQRWQQHTV